MSTELNYRSYFDGQKTIEPKSLQDLENLLAAVHDHAGDINSWRRNPATNVLELAMAAQSKDGLPQFFLVPKQGKLSTLERHLNQLLVASHGGFPPSSATVHEIWDLIDQTAPIR